MNTVSTPVFTPHEAGIIAMALSLIEEKRLTKGPVLACLDDFHGYLKLRFAGLVHEQSHVFYLDTEKRLITAEVAALGDQKSVTHSLRHIAGKAINLGADSIVITHNHPNGNATPSDNDVAHMEGAERSFGWLGISLLDSLVVTPSRIASVKAHREQQAKERSARWAEDNERRATERRAAREAKRIAKAVPIQQAPAT